MQQALSFVERLESKEVVHRSHNQQEGKAHLQNFVQRRQLNSSGFHVRQEVGTLELDG
jgi:hypothetical protein